MEEDYHAVFFSTLVDRPIAGIVEILERVFQFTQATKPGRVELVHELYCTGIINIDAAKSNQPVWRIVDNRLGGSEVGGRNQEKGKPVYGS
jgi:hypothetical protein